MSERAVAFARRLLLDSLRAAGLDDPEAVIDEEISLAAEPEAPATANGAMVRCAIFRRRSAVRVEVGADDGRLRSWSIEQLERRHGTELDAAACIAAAEAAARPPADAVLESAEYETQGSRTDFVVRWNHVHEGVPVERDVLIAYVNGATGRVHTVLRYWREVQPGVLRRSAWHRDDGP